MKKDQKDTENPPTHLSEKSFSVAFEQMASLLRSEVKLKDKSAKILTSNPLSTSFTHFFKQMAKLLRSEVHSLKKYSWKKR
jgi:hypothetical protein